MFNQCSGGASYVAEKCRPFFEVARQDRDVADTDAGQLAHHVHVGYATG